jgi:metallo-beta-lactamase family protein
LGSGYVQLSYTNGKESKIITFSGDVGSSHNLVLRDREDISETDSLVIESTYGNRSLDRTHVGKSLAEIVNKVTSRGGTLIIPAFAVGRTQDLLLHFWQLKKSNQIPAVPIYLDSPMAHEVTSIYLRHPEELQRTEDLNEIEQALRSAVIRPVLSADESMLLCMSTEPKIVISASGMLQGGRILHHLKSKLPDEKSGVLFVGYQGAGTKGRLLKEGLKTIRIHHKAIDVEAEVFSVEGLSAHADSEELMGWLRHLRQPPQQTLINHGELDSSQALQFRIQTELGWSGVTIPEMKQTISLD